MITGGLRNGNQVTHDVSLRTNQPYVIRTRDATNAFQAPTKLYDGMQIASMTLIPYDHEP
jgi:hypothetical protein